MQSFACPDFLLYIFGIHTFNRLGLNSGLKHLQSSKKKNIQYVFKIYSKYK